MSTSEVCFVPETAEYLSPCASYPLPAGLARIFA